MINTVSVFSLANPEHALGMLRLWGPLQGADIQMHWFLPNQPADSDAIASSDLIVIQRDYPRFVDKYAQLITLAATFNKPVVFEIDDLLWELPPEHPDRVSGHYTAALLPMWLAALHADAVTVASSGLADYIRPLNPQVWVLPNYLNERIWSFREPDDSHSAVIRIGYAGGDSHVPDLQMIAPILLDTLERYADKVSLKVWGFEPHSELAGHPLVTWEPLQPGDYAQFAATMSQQALDIALAPLRPSLFNRSKSPIKFFEYTALGVPCVCSTASPYRDVVEHGVTGFLADTHEQWQHVLELLINDGDLRLRIARQAQQHVRENWRLSTNAMKWADAYQSIVERHDAQGARNLRALQFSNLLAQVQEYMQQRDQQNAQIEAQNQRIGALEAELAEIKGSRVWSLVQRLWAWRATRSARSQHKSTGDH
jgi:glycosyltransferase involved in cell wall biosynthesis